MNWFPKSLFLGALAFCCSGAGAANSEPAAAPDEVVVMDLPGNASVKHARFHWIGDTNHAEGVIVLLDGENVAPDRLINDPEWRRFAAERRLVLCGVHFYSDENLNRAGTGYFDASRGSGAMLVEALNQAGVKDKPLLLFGFSGGARFIAGLLEWQPNLVDAWAAFSAIRWFAPEIVLPPGVVACGAMDGPRYGATLGFAQRARSLGSPVAWVSLGRVGHRRSLELEAFVRDFFASVMDADASELWIVADNLKKVVVESDATDAALTSALPNAGLLDQWKQLHEP